MLTKASRPLLARLKPRFGDLYGYVIANRRETEHPTDKSCDHPTATFDRRLARERGLWPIFMQGLDRRVNFLPSIT